MADASHGLATPLLIQTISNSVQCSRKVVTGFFLLVGLGFVLVLSWVSQPFSAPSLTMAGRLHLPSTVFNQFRPPSTASRYFQSLATASMARPHDSEDKYQRNRFGYHAPDISVNMPAQRPLDRPLAAMPAVRESGQKTATLYDMPVSNNGARARLIIYAKGLDTTGDVKIESPSTLGGLKSVDYLKMNPQGKMPALVTATGTTFYESDTIARYLIDAYSSIEPSFTPTTPEVRAVDNLIARIHDVYIVAIQACMYKATPPFGIYQSRWEALAEMKKQLSVIEGVVSEKGPFLTGETMALSDASLFPTMVFMRHMLPKFMQPGWKWNEAEAFGPKLLRWWSHMTGGDVPAASKVYEEIQGALNKWDDNGRWDSILLAGSQDTAESTIFDKIIKKEIPSEVVYEDSRCLVFKDISPAAPVHLLVIPKRREGLTQLRNSVQDHEYILGHLLRVAGEQGKNACGSGGFRIVINDGKEAAQTVFHLHIHVLGGREMTWPPG